MHRPLRCVLLLVMSSASAARDVAALQAVLAKVAEKLHKKYDMSVAAAFYAPWAAFEVAAGYTDRGLGMGSATRKAASEDLYVWGSTTKMFTAPAVLQLVERGDLSLEDSVVQHVDPVLQHLGAGKTMEQHFGRDIRSVKIKHLLHMTSGIQDYDGDAYSVDQFAHRSKAFGPVEIILKYTPSQLRFAAGTKQEYCSTNYVLLGLVLLRFNHADSWEWQSYDQMSVIPEALRQSFNESKFAMKGPCEDFTPVHGFMEAYSAAQLPPQDVSNVSCLGGWTAGNYVGSVRDVARFTYELYSRKSQRILSAASQTIMTDFTTSPPMPFQFYGVGTFNLAWSVGGGVEAYGHVGDTYGFQSQTTYFPSLDLVLSVATNVETASQAQPADFTCLAYNELVATLAGTAKPHCTFTVPHKFIGTCTCHSNDEVIVV